MAAGLLLVRGPVDQIQSLAAREQDIKWIKDYTKTSKTSQNVFCGSYWVHGVERYTVRDVVDHKESPLVVPVLSRRNGFNLEKYWDQHAINIGMEINKRNYISNRQFWCAVWLPGYVKLTASIHNDGDHSHHRFHCYKPAKNAENLMKSHESKAKRPRKSPKPFQHISAEHLQSPHLWHADHGSGGNRWKALTATRQITTRCTSSGVYIF